MVNQTDDESILDLSDEELSNMASAPPVNPEENTSTGSSESVTDGDDETSGDTGSQEQEDAPEGSEDGSEDKGEDGTASTDDDDQSSASDDEGNSEKQKEPKNKNTEQETTDKDQKKTENKTDDNATQAPLTIEQKQEAYDKIMAPFKANGKTFELKSPEEVIKLMQLGANYTKRMQQLTPNLKIVKMLERSGMLDESKLSFLIDLDKGNPEALQKFLKDKKIDPLDIDTSAESNYVEGNHRVSDSEINFENALQETLTVDGGRELISVINDSWDQSSKNEIFQEPRILTTLAEQKQLGIFDQIAAEVERRKTFGSISLNTPFIHAYHDVGKEMASLGLLKGVNAPKQNNPAPVEATRPRSNVATNGDKAKAASPTRTAPTSAKSEVNYLDMSDEDFVKAMSGRN